MLQCAFLTTMLHISSTVLSAFSKFGEFFSFKCFDFEFETEGVTSYYYDTFLHEGFQVSYWSTMVLRCLQFLFALT